MIQGQSVMHYVTYPHSPQRVARALVDLRNWRCGSCPTNPGRPITSPPEERRGGGQLQRERRVVEDQAEGPEQHPDDELDPGTE